MKKHVWFLCLCCLAAVPMEAQRAPKQQGRQIVITNTSSLVLKDKPVSIQRSKLKSIPPGKLFPIVTSQKDTIPAQVDDMDGDGVWDELFFVIDLEPNQEKLLTLKWVATAPDFVKRTSVRFGKRLSPEIPLQNDFKETLYAKELPRSLGFQRYQTDGPSWENDKVGFRHYLDGRNAKDVFGKLIPGMALENVGINAKGEVEDNYHVMEKWGRDILAVGNSVGIGGFAVINGDSLLRLGVTVEDKVNNVEKTSFKILTEGPSRSAMNFAYHNWKPAGHSYTVNEITSITPGRYAFQNTVKISGLQGADELGIGLVNLNAVNKPIEIKLNDKWVALVSHEKHSYNKEWWLGLALIVPSKGYLGFMDAPKTGQLSNSYMARLSIKDDQSITYYAVAGWELSDEGFKDPAYFQRYVEDLVKQISAEIKITVK